VLLRNCRFHVAVMHQITSNQQIRNLTQQVLGELFLVCIATDSPDCKLIWYGPDRSSILGGGGDSPLSHYVLCGQPSLLLSECGEEGDFFPWVKLQELLSTHRYSDMTPSSCVTSPPLAAVLTALWSSTRPHYFCRSQIISPLPHMDFVLSLFL